MIQNLLYHLIFENISKNKYVKKIHKIKKIDFDHKPDSWISSSIRRLDKRNIIYYICVMSSVKEIVSDIIQRQPADASYEEIIKEIAFARMIERGLADSDAGRIFSTDDVRKKIQEWQK